MKKSLLIAFSIVMLLPCFAACRDDKQDEISEEDIVCPSVRESENQSKAIYASTGKTIQELVDNSGVIAHVRIKNWLGDAQEEKYRGVTCFEAEVLDIYKGEAPEEIVIVQSGTSQSTHKGFPLFTYGKEMILFLKSGDDLINEARQKYPEQTFSDFEHENAHKIMGGPCNIWYVETLDSGETYIIQKMESAVRSDFYEVVKEQNLGEKELPVISTEAYASAKALLESDPIDNAGANPDYVFKINVLTDYIEGLIDKDHE